MIDPQRRWKPHGYKPEYAGLATVVAASDVRLLRVPCDVLNELVRANFELERAIDRVARERLRIIAR